MNVFLLTKVIAGSTDEKLIQLFQTEPALQKYVAENYPPVIRGTSLSPNIYLSTLRVRTLQTEEPVVVAPVEPDVDLADRYITVPSQTDPKKVYSVAVDNGKVVACSCPAFEFHPEQGQCKHMWSVMVNPRYHGAL